jgi:hypothetical protein
MNLHPLLFLALTGPLLAQDGFPFSSADDYWRGALRPSLETIFWSGDTPRSGLVDTPDDSFLAPRFSLALDAAAGEQFFFHTTARWDRGFDQGNEPDGQARLDEIFLRVRPLSDERLEFQIGKFATVFGAWVSQHDFDDDPFLLAPLSYGQGIGVQNYLPAALTPTAIAARANGTAPAFSQLSKQGWASQLWGPSYATGASVSGSIQRFDYAAEVKSSGLSSHSDEWESETGDFSAPTFTGRLGFRPDAAWAFGTSASYGSYLAEDAEALLPAGTDRGDLAQTTLGLDARWAHRDWIITGEIIGTEYETLEAGDLRTLGWFLGTRYKAAPGVWLAGRFGQLLSNEITSPMGDSIPWTPDVWRAELAAGWRINSHILLKANYAFTHSDDDTAGENLLGMGIGLKW